MRKRAGVTSVGLDFGISALKAAVAAEGSIRVLRTLPYSPALAKEVESLTGNSAQVGITGARQSRCPKRILGSSSVICEIDAIGRGAQHISDAKELLAISLGVGTCMVSAGKDYTHAGGTALGAGTISGLGKLLLHVEDCPAICGMAEKGSLEAVDLLVKDLYPEGVGFLKPDSSASHFGNAKGARDVDLARGIVHLVGQSIGSIAALAAKQQGRSRIVLAGGLARSALLAGIIKKRCVLIADVSVAAPKDCAYATAIGCALLAGSARRG